MASLIPASSYASPVTFFFKDKPIRTLMDDGALWFVARDVTKALNLVWHGQILNCLPTDWKSVRKLLTESTKKKGGGMRDMTVISEPAVYKLAFRSNKPEADEFTNMVASEILPTIRKTGKFEAKALPSALSPDQQQHLRNLVAARAKALPHGAGFPQIWERVKNHFGVARYQDIPATQFESVVEYLLKMEIKAIPPEPAPERFPSASMDHEFTETMSFIRGELGKEMFNRRSRVGLIKIGSTRKDIEASHMLVDLPSDMLHRGIGMVEAGFFCIHEAFKLLEALPNIKSAIR